MLGQIQTCRWRHQDLDDCLFLIVNECHLKSLLKQMFEMNRNLILEGKQHIHKPLLGS